MVVAGGVRSRLLASRESISLAGSARFKRALLPPVLSVAIQYL